MLITLIVLGLFLPYGAKWLFSYDPFRGLDPESSRTVALTIATIQLLGILALVGIVMQLQAQRRRNQYDAYLKLVENANSLAELPFKYEKLYDCLERMYVTKIPTGGRPSNSISNGSLYLYYLSIVCNVFEQFFVFWQKSWIDKETWLAWDRWFREVYLGQFPADVKTQGRISHYEGQDLDEEDKNFADNSLKLFEEWWNEIQNRRYYRKDFREYVDKLLEDSRQKKPSLLSE